jgi:polyferredoxin
MRRDAGPWTADKTLRKIAKHSLWLAVALWTGFTFVGYFTPIKELGVEFVQAQMGSWEIFWSLFYGFATYGNAGFMREQVCKHMCPYARFQSAMFDKDTLIVTYDEERGEPRCACRFAPPVSISAKVCSTSVLAVALVRMCATR